jgi:hypothetical protein
MTMHSHRLGIPLFAAAIAAVTIEGKYHICVRKIFHPINFFALSAVGASEYWISACEKYCC